MLNNTWAGYEQRVANLERFQVITGVSNKMFSLNDLFLKEFFDPRSLSLAKRHISMKSRIFLFIPAVYIRCESLNNRGDKNIFEAKSLSYEKENNYDYPTGRICTLNCRSHVLQ